MVSKNKVQKSSIKKVNWVAEKIEPTKINYTIKKSVESKPNEIKWAIEERKENNSKKKKR